MDKFFFVVVHCYAKKSLCKCILSSPLCKCKTSLYFYLFICIFWFFIRLKKFMFIDFAMIYCKNSNLHKLEGILKFVKNQIHRPFSDMKALTTMLFPIYNWDVCVFSIKKFHLIKQLKNINFKLHNNHTLILHLLIIFSTPKFGKAPPPPPPPHVCVDTLFSPLGCGEYSMDDAYPMDGWNLSYEWNLICHMDVMHDLDEI
jgi:hypothetical protein